MAPPRRECAPRLDQVPTTADSRTRRSPWRGCAIAAAAIAGLFVLVVVALLLFLKFAGPFRWDDSSSGWSAVWVGDLDGDDVPDLALGIAFEPGRGPLRLLSGVDGRVLGELEGVLLHGNPDPVVGPLGERGYWWQSGYHTLHLLPDGIGGADLALDVDLGEAVSPMGDVDGDGAIDVLVSGFPRNAGRDSISVVSTRTGAAIWTLSRHEDEIPQLQRFGWKGCAVGDVNGDGAADAAIVDERDLVLLVDGRTGSTLREIEHSVEWGMGELTPLGDLDGDGVPELALYEGWADYDSKTYAETRHPVRVVSCASGELLATHRVDHDLFKVFSPGDIDGDGALDLGWLGGGLVVVRAASGDRLLSLERGWSGAGRADLDGDGCDDVLVAHNVVIDQAIDPPDDLWRLGRIEVVSGRDGSILRTFDEAVLPPR